MKIFVWGFYEEGNYGDDAMGFIIARHFRGSGHEVNVFEINPNALAGTNATTTPHLEAARHQILLIIGGGNSYRQHIYKKII